VTNEDFGRYTVSARKYAATNPKAWFYERPITLDDHQASRWIVEPVLRLYDCCQESDGGVALVVTRADRAAEIDAPVAIRAVADGNLDLDGALPTNTHGGLLGEAYIHGINSIQEGVRQVRGTAVNQAADVEHVLVSSLNSGLVLGRA